MLEFILDHIWFTICIIVVLLAILVWGGRRGCYGDSREAPDIPENEVEVRLH